MDLNPAEPVAISTFASAVLGRSGTEVGEGGALSVDGELGLGRIVALDGLARGGMYADGHVGFDTLVGVRAWLEPPSKPLSFAVFGLGGATIVPELAPQAWLGIELGIASNRPLSFRIGFAGQVLSLPEADVGSPVAAELRAGLTWRPHRPAPAPVAEAAAPPVAPVPPIPGPAARVVWVPHPVCAWVPINQLSALADLPPETAAWLVEAGRAPGTSTLGEAATAPLGLAPLQGAVVIGGVPGDQLRVGSTALTVGSSSGVVLTAPPGPVQADVTGGGRAAHLEGAVADGYVLWLRTPRPEPLTVRFSVGSSVVDGAGLAALRAFAERRGGLGYEVRGGYSVEGDPIANQRLAEDRARSVRAALLAAGVPADRVTLADAAPIVGDADAGRVATVTPRSAP